MQMAVPCRGAESPSIPRLGENPRRWRGGPEHRNLVGSSMERGSEGDLHHGVLSGREGSIVYRELHKGHLVMLVHGLLDEDGVEHLPVLPLLLCLCLRIW
ncbi:hypothetical protein GUJ93_ZPchr0002g26245 [Zizania palustris]|uniref:Uncharacterized protein n=1 Tax=Zizania palustris TaxID=103762 RepID=A0A8J5SS90_ZIZPA|nr:hypothetical protein GUJ93_ZPchr0002g26245 [Zizania palustris]